MGVEIAVAVVVLFFVAVLVRTIRIIPQARVGVIQRLGSFHRAADSGLTIVLPFIDKMLPLVDTREQVVNFPPQPVITADNVTIDVTTVVYYQIHAEEVRKNSALGTASISSYPLPSSWPSISTPAGPAP
jgi:regulator of protease activity HflC (stomatin/prohibitin superfamily)